MPINEISFVWLPYRVEHFRPILCHRSINNFHSIRFRSTSFSLCVFCFANSECGQRLSISKASTVTDMVEICWMGLKVRHVDVCKERKLKRGNWFESYNIINWIIKCNFCFSSVLQSLFITIKTNFFTYRALWTVLNEFLSHIKPSTRIRTAWEWDHRSQFCELFKIESLPAALVCEAPEKHCRRGGAQKTLWLFFFELMPI